MSPSPCNEAPKPWRPGREARNTALSSVMAQDGGGGGGGGGISKSKGETPQVMGKIQPGQVMEIKYQPEESVGA